MCMNLGQNMLVKEIQLDKTFQTHLQSDPRYPPKMCLRPPERLLSPTLSASSMLSHESSWKRCVHLLETNIALQRHYIVINSSHHHLCHDFVISRPEEAGWRPPACQPWRQHEEPRIHRCSSVHSHCLSLLLLLLLLLLRTCAFTLEPARSRIGTSSVA